MTVKTKSELDADIVAALVPGTLNRVSEIVTISQDIVDSALFEEDVATVALTGDFNDLLNQPSGGASVSDAAYSSDWDTVTDIAPSKNAVYDQIEVVLGQIDTFLEDTRLVATGTGLTGGGDLTEDRTIALSAGSIASLADADTAVQPADLHLVATTGSFNDLEDNPISDAAFGVGWNGDTGAASKNALYDKIAANDTLIAGKANTSHTHVVADITDLDVGDFATAAQGALADTSVQSNTTQAGGGAIVDNAVVISNAAYTAIVTKDPTTIYYIVG